MSSRYLPGDLTAALDRGTVVRALASMLGVEVSQTMHISRVEVTSMNVRVEHLTEERLMTTVDFPITGELSGGCAMSADKPQPRLPDPFQRPDDIGRVVMEKAQRRADGYMTGVAVLNILFGLLNSVLLVVVLLVLIFRT